MVKPSRPASQSASPPCPCGSGKSYPACCGRFHSGTPAPDAEALMRSRYSAYALGLEAYLLATWHASTRPASVLDAANPPRWIRLKVISHHATDERATVHFIATCRIQGRAEHMEEVSRFVCESGRWFYVDGEVSSG
ncbi:YchJ family metal-binding protein [Niveibacterium sp. SC-1]|uniref:YchJ family protein n=1 Tax=Niveibacterium sp. SC-1 TaxID=3135646 RepID=UPI00311EFB55